MARNALIVDQSQTMRNILRNILQANLGDFIVSDVPDIAEAAEFIARGGCHFIFYSWDMIRPDFVGLLGELQNMPIADRAHFVLLVSALGERQINLAIEAGVARENIVLCQPASLIEAVNRICNPVGFRSSKRYSIRETNALLEQGGKSFHAVVVNLSMGGALVDMEFALQFCWYLPARMHLRFASKINGDSAKNIEVAVVNISVTETNADNSPKTIRVGLRFLGVNDAARSVLEKAFLRAEKEERALDALN